ncbi:MAG TPA: sensor histidine kinase [Chthoniobacterales bacterium]|nr:sensor histidine kinase [Chthoniobacterales bacterium]
MSKASAIADELDTGTIPFQAEGRLLQELGLRLVAKPEVALVELIKNAYDADSPICTVRLEDNEKRLVVADEGVGMTIDDFKTKWMRIATSSKLANETSPKYHRPLTGAKGIGRFAVRYLGDYLVLESIAWDKHYGFPTKLTARFDWQKLDRAEDIGDTSVEYTLTRAADGVPAGTTLTITKLREATDFAKETKLRDEVLRIVSPLQALDSGPFQKLHSGDGTDSGFRVVLPGQSSDEDVDLAGLVLGNYWGRLVIELDKQQLKFRVWLPNVNRPKMLNVKVRNSISKGLFADIRFFPRRKGIFQSKGFNGQKAWRWVRDNCGIRVVDHGFHIRPYGFPNDDWLQLDIDKSHSERNWRTAIAKKHFPLNASEKVDPAANPVLYLPYNFQLVGAVFVETRRKLGGKDVSDLVPAMDREGLLENESFDELRRFVRAGIEFLAHEDKDELDRRAEVEAKEIAREAREEIRRAIRYIEDSPTLTSGDKVRIVKQYRHLAERIDEQEEYSAQARRSLLTMSLLGVVAGFMTHESKAMVSEMEAAVETVSKLARKHPELKDSAIELSKRLKQFQSQLDYVRLFVQNVRSSKEKSLSAAGQVRLILRRFEPFAIERGIKVTNQVPDNVETPRVPVTAYSGILLNLFTNALKAVSAAQASIAHPKITFRGWNEKSKHVIEVADNGVGVPPDLQKRIWEPLYTTTSDVGNPLGSGMGLGLSVVKQVVSELGGSVSLVSRPPPGYTTCFRVVLPR